MILRVVVCAGLFIQSVFANAGPDQSKAADGTVKAHHVRLAGHEGNSDLGREVIVGNHAACKTAREQKKLPFAPLPALPARFYPGTMDIYYTDRFSLVVHDFDHYKIDIKGDCSMRTVHTQIRELYSYAGRCDMEAKPDKPKRAAGVCDFKRHEQAAAGAIQRPPANLTGTTRSFAGMQCAVHSMPLNRGELCIAEIDNPFPASPSVQNAGQPGLLLSIDTQALKYTAVSVQVGTQVSRSVFEVPGGYTVRNVDWKP